MIIKVFKILTFLFLCSCGMQLNNGTKGRINISESEAFARAESSVVDLEDAFCVNTDIKVFLEGPYSSGATMATAALTANALPGLGTHPSGQPYSGAPWNYGGAEGTAAGFTYPANTVDWVLVSFREDYSYLGSNDFEMAALVLDDGSIDLVDRDCVDINPDREYYVVIQHRNHLDVVSHQKLPVVSNTITYNFSLQDSLQSPDMITAGKTGQIVDGALYAMITGDVDGDGDVDEDDRIIVMAATNPTSVDNYSPEDVSLNSILNVLDLMLTSFRRSGGYFSPLR